MNPFGRLGLAPKLCVVAASAVILSACGTLEGKVALGVVGTTLAGSNSPNSEIQQIYYLGVFDPREQLPPQIYRVRVHGQASAISATRFASGWVQANVVDSLATSIGFDQEGDVQIAKKENQFTPIETGRRLVLFGPEGFREAPKDHRLVIVMGSNPEDFFNAIDQSLGIVAEAVDERRNTALGRLLFDALAEVKAERERLAGLVRATESELPARTGGS